MNETRQIKLVTADPSAEGLFGLAMVTLVASSEKLGWTSGTSLLIPWALFLGAAAQFYASMQDSKHNNVFGATAFAGYGLFWFAIGMSWMIQEGVLGATLQQNTDPKQLGVAFIGYLIFTLFMTLGALETNKVLFMIFFFINFLFIGLSMYSFGIAPHFSHALAGWSELIISMLSFYGCAAAVLNAHFEREFLPVGKPFGIFKKQAKQVKVAA